MSLPSSYVEAIETRLRWLRWARTGPGEEQWQRMGFAEAMPAYLNNLEHAESFFMDPHFTALVDTARRSVPDDLAYDPKWLLARQGFVFLPEPFEVPELEARDTVIERDPTLSALDPQARALAVEKIKASPRLQVRVRAVGWNWIPPGANVGWWERGERKPTVAYHAPEGAIQVVCFQDLSLYDLGPGFGAWSYFVLRPGQEVGPRIRDFETRQADGRYADNPTRRRDPIHEIRWVYAALHLMAQRLATTVRHDTDRTTRRRAEQNRQVAPPFIKVITLRRLQQARERAGRAAEAVDWQWQWSVTGHWRNQFYPSEACHKRIFIESYIKGDPDKPFKDNQVKLFVARR